MKGPARVPALAGYGGRSPAAAISGNPSQSKLRSPSPHRLGISVATGSGPAVRQARTRTPALHVAGRKPRQRWSTDPIDPDRKFAQGDPVLGGVIGTVPRASGHAA